ncbi:MAG: hypothetical protein ACXWWC_06705 [Chitinophagaceae bacterium]
MKPLLLLVVIHLMVFHQYKKDKSETLAPKNYKPEKILTPSYNQYYLNQGTEINGNDSSGVFNQSKPVAYDYVNYMDRIK